jgi:thioredoxin 1
MGAGIVRIVTDASFERDVPRAERLAFIAFGAPWCGPCRLLSPALRALAAKEADRLFVGKLDVDANPATAERYGVDSYPTCILFRCGEEISRIDGYASLRRIEERLAPYLEEAARRLDAGEGRKA